jgi:hypothetical protein
VEIQAALQKSGSRLVLVLVAREGKTLFLAVQPEVNQVRALSGRLVVGLLIAE